MDENPYKAPETAETGQLSPHDRRMQLWGIITLPLIFSMFVAVFLLFIGGISDTILMGYLVAVFVAMGAVAFWADCRELRWWIVLFWLAAIAIAIALYAI